jgi:hypothetical protein
MNPLCTAAAAALGSVLDSNSNSNNEADIELTAEKIQRVVS